MRADPYSRQTLHCITEILAGSRAVALAYGFFFEKSNDSSRRTACEPRIPSVCVLHPTAISVCVPSAYRACHTQPHIPRQSAMPNAQSLGDLSLWVHVWVQGAFIACVDHDQICRVSRRVAAGLAHHDDSEKL